MLPAISSSIYKDPRCKGKCWEYKDIPISCLLMVFKIYSGTWQLGLPHTVIGGIFQCGVGIVFRDNFEKV